MLILVLVPSVLGSECRSFSSSFACAVWCRLPPPPGCMLVMLLRVNLQLYTPLKCDVMSCHVEGRQRGEIEVSASLLSPKGFQVS